MRLSWRQGLCNGQKVLMWREAHVPCFCLFPVMLEQLSTAKRPKTLEKFPCTYPFLTSSSYHSLLLLCGSSFCLCSPIHMLWPGLLLPRKHRLLSQFLLFSQCYRHSMSHTWQVGPNHRYTSSILCFHMVSNYAASSWKHNSKYNFGTISSEGISFSDCLQGSELPFANSSSLLLCPPLKVYHACYVHRKTQG